MPRTVDSEPLASPQLAKPSRLAMGDPIRLIGTVAVIVGHVCDMELFNYAGSVRGGRMLDWWICCILDVASRWAVPVFIMLSGALLLGQKHQTPREFYGRRFSRVGVATLFWSPLFMFFAVWYLPESWGRSWHSVSADLLLGVPYAHMHFLFRIVGLYLFTPALRIFVQHASGAMLWSTVLLCFAVAGGHSVLSVLTGGQPNAFSRFVPFVGYFLAGYALRHVRVGRGGLLAAWAGFVATTAIVAWSMGHLLGRLGQTPPLTTGAGLLLDKLYAGYPVAHLGLEFLNPVRIVMGLCVWFIFAGTFKHPWPDRQPWRWLSRVGAPATLGIYLVHPLFREALYLKGYSATWHGALVGIPIVTLLVLVGSTLLTLALMYNPMARRTVGSDPIELPSKRGRILALGALLAVGGATAALLIITRPARQPRPQPTAAIPVAPAAPATTQISEDFIGQPGHVEGYPRASASHTPLPGPTSKPAAPATHPVLAASAVPADRPGHYRLVYRKKIGDRELVRPYLLYLPEGYRHDASRKWPLLLFLHGGWEGGADYDLLLLHGPPKLVEFYPRYRANLPFIVLSPQCEYDRSFAQQDMGDYALDLLETICASYRVDRQRIYGTGLSIGAQGIWSLAMRRPELFAAIAPLCAKGVDAPSAAKAIGKLSVFTAVGANDYQEFQEAGKTLVSTLRGAGGNVEFQILPACGHDVWTTLYAQRWLYDWFLKYRRN